MSIGRKPKKLLLRIRHWLIKKLGGYTEQMVPPAVRYPPSVMLHPERVIAQAIISGEEMTGRFGHIGIDVEKFMHDGVKQQLAELMVREIVDKGFGVITCEPYLPKGWNSRVYRMELCLIRPSEWMKTELGNNMRPGPVT